MRGFIRDRRAATMMEFAILAPVFILFLFGGLDAGYNFYTKAVLDGEMQKAARDLSLEDASDPARKLAIQQRVRTAVQRVMKNATVDMTTRYYHDYTNAAGMEEFTDSNHDGRCNNSESYVDSNNNGMFDIDAGVDGIGGSRDVVVFVATASYPRLIISSFIFGPGTTVLTSKTMLRNQPASDQAAAPLRLCR